MRLIKSFLKRDKVIRRKRLNELAEEYRSQLAGEQFKILVDRGLNVPVAYL